MVFLRALALRSVRRHSVALLCLCLTCVDAASAIDESSPTTELSPVGDPKVKQEELGMYRTAGLVNQSLRNPEVRQAILRVPRHLFVPDEVAQMAYEPRALPIGKGQTISQPYIVALMTEQARITRGSKVLEIGTGSGYQAAVLAELGARVFSIEIIPELAAEARSRLASLGYTGVTVREGDGWVGWQEEAPFDAILVTAATPVVPEKLVKQLANKGRLIVPLERSGEKGERLLVIERDGENLIRRDLGAVRFVPLTGIAGALREQVEEGQKSILEELTEELGVQKSEPRSSTTDRPWEPPEDVLEKGAESEEGDDDSRDPGEK